MSGHWLTANKAVFTRDLLRDYCQVCAILHEQRQRFAASSTISHAVLRELLGEAMHKGVFWRLKDTAHHLFRQPHGAVLASDEGLELWQYSSEKTPGGMVQQSSVEALLDWCLGYAFHECVKLKEDAFQRQHYASRLMQMRGKVDLCEDILARLIPLMGQTRESIGREMTRILEVLQEARSLLIHYLGEQGKKADNGHVARFIVAEEDLVRQVFGSAYGDLLQSLYAGDPTRLYLLAAKAYLDGGRPAEALGLLDRAAEQGEEVQRLREQADIFDLSRTAG